MASRQIFVCRDIREEQLFMQVSFFPFAGKASGHGPSPSQTTAENVLHWVECPIFAKVVSKFFSGKTRPRVRKEKKKKVEL